MKYLFLFLTVAFLSSSALGDPESTILNSKKKQESKLNFKEDWEYNYKSACVFSDFLMHLIPPIDKELIKSKNTFELDNTWLLGIYGFDRRSKYYVSKKKKIQVYFVKTPTGIIFRKANIQYDAIPNEYRDPNYLSWIFDFKKEFILSGEKTIGCESYDISFEFSPPPEEKLILINIHSFIE